jgi:LysM repeat protein
MPVYNPIKPTLPKDEFKSSNRKKIVLMSISVVLILGSIILLYYAFRPVKATTQSTSAPAKQETTTETPKETPKQETQNSTKASGQTYKVESGDTLYTIGQKFSVDWHDIASANNLKEPYSLKVGQELTIPAKSSANSSSQ